MYPYYGDTTSSITFTGGIPAGTTVLIQYPYTANRYVRGNRHVDLDRMAELQKLIAKNPNRTDLKMELLKLQKTLPKKIGKPKRKKRK